MLTTVEILKKARALVEKPGTWMQGPEVPRNCGKNCAWTAIYEASRGCMTDPDALSALREAIGTAAVWEWNDTPGRTQAEVLAAFEKAIELAERSNG